MSESASDMPSASVALKDQAEPAHKRMQIRGKLKATLDAMVWDGLEWQAAAKAHNFHVVSMRKAMGLPHVQAYLRSERQVLRESLSPRNIHRLREIRDAADNMPAIQAIRTLEGMGDDAIGGVAAVSHSPGITIRILNVTQSAQVDERQPVMTMVEAARTIPADSD